MKSTNAMQKPCDGIFLIRPSTSRPGFYALDISKNGNVVSSQIINGQSFNHLFNFVSIHA
jgi:hypothetical protein